ncbi:hypothetical protein [Caproicibacter fermentans]|nr:hypothetical protein [Caproicibacter fermentans]
MPGLFTEAGDMLLCSYCDEGTLI